MASPLLQRPRSPRNDTSVPGGVQRQPKRRGVALSCAECRRLKLKCSREFPCNNCVKKGCGAICPEGSLTTGKGNRFVLANTEALHDKINVLATRVRALEDALLAAHRLTSSTPHPLLTEELLQLKRPLERERQDAPSGETEDKQEAEDNIDSLGSLSISNSGRSMFFGTTANSWYLLQNEEGSDSDSTPADDDMLPLHEQQALEPADPAWLAHAFPFSPPVARVGASMRAAIVNKLPRASGARRLADVYFRHAAWMYTPISEEDFYETIFRPIYEPDAHILHSASPDLSSAGSPTVSNPALTSMPSTASIHASSMHTTTHSSMPSTASSVHTDTPPPTTPDAHHLAVLCLVLAIGTLVDLDRPAHAPEAMQYYHYARAALGMESVLEEQSTVGIQALLLMCHFMFIGEISSPRWAIMGIAVKMAQSIGLHRDSGKWKLDPTQTRKRRALFYELLTYDSWQSLTFGRPPSLSVAHVDSQFPDDVVPDPTGNTEMSFSAWKHRFAAQCLSQVHDEAFGARTPRYKVIQDLDKKVRGWPIPPSLQVPGFGAKVVGPSEVAEQPSVQLTMQRYIAFAIREITLFYMHRGFFAQAMEDSPADPMGSKWSASVLAAYKSATTFVGLIESLFNQQPQLTERMWFLFTHVFSCAIVLGSIAQKSQMALSRSALSHLDSAYNLFQKVSDHVRAGKILPILAKLRERAQMAQQAMLSIPPQVDSVAARQSLFSPSVKSENAELSALGGMTRLVPRRPSASPSVSSASPPSLRAASHPASSPTLTDAQQAAFMVPSAADVNVPPAWGNSYTHIQNLNVNIGMSDAYYASGLPGPAGGMPPDMHQDSTMVYQMSPTHGHSHGHSHSHSVHSHQQQQFPQHLHHPSHSPGPGHTMTLDMHHGQQQFFGGSFGGYNGGQYMMHTPSPEMMPAGHDPQDSWHNFMAQYKT